MHAVFRTTCPCRHAPSPRAPCAPVLTGCIKPPPRCASAACPPPPPPPPLCAGCVPCVWSLLEDTAVHPFVDASAVGIKGASRCRRSSAPSMPRCESESGASRTFKFGDDAHKCWLMSTWSRATSVAGFASGFCGHGARACAPRRRAGVRRVRTRRRADVVLPLCAVGVDACSSVGGRPSAGQGAALLRGRRAAPPPPPPPPQAGVCCFGDQRVVRRVRAAPAAGAARTSRRRRARDVRRRLGLLLGGHRRRRGAGGDAGGARGADGGGAPRGGGNGVQRRRGGDVDAGVRARLSTTRRRSFRVTVERVADAHIPFTFGEDVSLGRFWGSSTRQRRRQRRHGADVCAARRHQAAGQRRHGRTGQWGFALDHPYKGGGASRAPERALASAGLRPPPPSRRRPRRGRRRRPTRRRRHHRRRRRPHRRRRARAAAATAAFGVAVATAVAAGAAAAGQSALRSEYWTRHDRHGGVAAMVRASVARGAGAAEVRSPTTCTTSSTSHTPA